MASYGRCTLLEPLGIPVIIDLMHGWHMIRESAVMPVSKTTLVLGNTITIKKDLYLPADIAIGNTVVIFIFV